MNEIKHEGKPIAKSLVRDEIAFSITVPLCPFCLQSVS